MDVHEQIEKDRHVSVTSNSSTSVGMEARASDDVRNFFSFRPVKSEQISYLRSVLLLAADILPKHCVHPVYKRPI